MIIVARQINGISLNGPEYLLDDNGEILRFENKDRAIAYLKKIAGMSAEEIGQLSFVYTNERKECNCHLCEKRDDCYMYGKFQRLPRDSNGLGGLGLCPKLTEEVIP